MEPLNAVASVSPAGDAAEIWGGTQSQTTAHGGAGQGARHSARQGQAARPADGRRLRPARQSRRGIHHRRGDAVEGGGQAGQGRCGRARTTCTTAASGRSRRTICAPGSTPRASSSRGITASRSTASRRSWIRCATSRRGGRDGIVMPAPTSRLRRSAPAGRAALPRHRRAHQSAARHRLDRQQVRGRGLHG